MMNKKYLKDNYNNLLVKGDLCLDFLFVFIYFEEYSARREYYNFLE